MRNNKVMIARVSGVLLVGALAFAASFTGHQSGKAAPPRQDTPPRSVTVTGNGISYGSPDIASISLGVESANPVVIDAVNDANTRMTAVMAALSEAGIAPEDIRTEFYNIYQEKGFTPEGMPSIDPATGQPMATYRVTNVVNITVRDVTKVGEILGLAVNAGANVVNNISFGIEDRAGLESEARIDAVADARARAEQLGEALGFEVGEVLNVSEGINFGPGPLFEANSMGFGGDGAPISTGSLGVNISVTVTFAIN